MIVRRVGVCDRPGCERDVTAFHDVCLAHHLADVEAARLRGELGAIREQARSASPQQRRALREREERLLRRLDALTGDVDALRSAAHVDRSPRVPWW